MSRKVSRREFLRLSGLSLAGLFLPPRDPEEELLALLERAGEPLARGVFTDIGGKQYGNPIEIMSGDKYFRYLVKDRGQLKRVLIKTVQVTEGYPFSEVVTSPRIGMRLDSASLMEHVAPSGAGSVRIFGPIEEVGVRGSVLENALVAAEAQDLSPLLVFAPTWPREDGYIRDRVGSVIENHPTTVFNLGNEPDNIYVEFWKDHDLPSFAHFAMTALGAIWDRSWSRGGDTLAVISAVQDIKNQRRYLETLRDAGVNFNNPYLKFGLHTYQSVSDLVYKMPIVRNAFARVGVKKPPLWITEGGVTYPGWSKWITLEMAQEAFRQGVERFYVHTLVDGEEGFELMNGDGSVHLPTYYGFQSLARRL